MPMVEEFGEEQQQRDVEESNEVEVSIFLLAL